VAEGKKKKQGERCIRRSFFGVFHWRSFDGHAIVLSLTSSRVAGSTSIAMMATQRESDDASSSSAALSSLAASGSVGPVANAAGSS